jgi:hypothetical protein
MIHGSKIIQFPELVNYIDIRTLHLFTQHLLQSSSLGQWQLLPMFVRLLEAFLKTLVSAAVASALTLGARESLPSHGAFYSSGNRKKSGGDKSGEYGGCFKTVTLCSATYFSTSNDRCTNSSGHFLLTASLRRRTCVRVHTPCWNTFLLDENLCFARLRSPAAQGHFNATRKPAFLHCRLTISSFRHS